MQEISKKKSILIVEDDQKLNDLISEHLVKNNYKTHQAHDYSKIENILASFEIHLIILDIMLPELNGFDICKRIRKNSDIPILFLSARGDITDKVVGLELGADDYMSKPFHPRELLARIEAILRRTQIVDKEKFVLGELTIDWRKKKVFLKENTITLTYLEYELLALLAKNKGEILDRDYILKNLHDLEWDGFNRSIDVLVGRLRKKINDTADNPLIRTVWGRGYAME
jgi:two-component system phosphate regulon response regulator OmpR